MNTDCFAYHRAKKCCTILCENVCDGGKCRFYKTREQFNADRLKYGGVVKMHGVIGRTAKIVRWVQTGKLYACAEDAAKELGVTPGAIRAVCSGHEKRIKGQVYEYVD